MKIEIPLTNAVLFETDESTVLHLHTGQVLDQASGQRDLGERCRRLGGL